jgi:hypothetical protein
MSNHVGHNTTFAAELQIANVAVVGFRTCKKEKKLSTTNYQLSKLLQLF